jgi:hypothetical protein
LLTIVGSTFISLANFYFVKNTIQRDRETRVGEILASTPLSKLLYILSKVLSNFAVLSLMIVILVLSAIVMQLVRGEDTHIQLWKLLAPFLFLAVPVMAVVAAVAVLFETIPFLRSGFGNVAYFFLWAFALSLSVIPHFPASDLAGIGLVKDSTIAAAHLSENTDSPFLSMRVNSARPRRRSAGMVSPGLGRFFSLAFSGLALPSQFLCLLPFSSIASIRPAAIVHRPHLLFPVRPLHSRHLPYPLLYPYIRLRRSRSPQSTPACSQFSPLKFACY